MDSESSGASLARKRAVICIDGIVSATARKITPEIGWSAYRDRLAARRPDLDIVHLKQPHDWLDILTGAAADYPNLIKTLAKGLLGAEGSSNWEEIVLLGFSLGGLNALNVAHEVSRFVKTSPPRYIAYVTFGTPFGGTGFLTDAMIRRISLSYIQRLFDKPSTLQYFKELLDFAQHSQLSIMLHSVQNDEMVSANSATLPSDWLLFANMPEGALPGLRWGTFEIATRRRFRAHDSLLYNPIALAYIDGIVDGLLPQ